MDQVASILWFMIYGVQSTPKMDMVNRKINMGHLWGFTSRNLDGIHLDFRK